MLKFNSYRADRYLRSRFIEGKYLLASEATDLELELFEALRRSVASVLGSDVAIDNAWKVTRLSATQILVAPGEAWFKGLPVHMRSGKDQLVSGAILAAGIVPAGIVISDDANGAGKIITFNSGSTTPTNNYKVVVTIKEELLTEVDDPFLQNANLTESTAQKIRLVFQLNLVPTALQTESPIPYRDESSVSGSATNYPNSGGFAAPNLVNRTVVTPTSGGNGELISISAITGSEKIDGRDLELVIRNNPGVGGGIVLPNSPTGQISFSNGKLIDSNGVEYHINQIFNDTISTQLVIRIDKEPDQPNPEILNTKPYSLIKRDVYVTDDINGSPQGKIYWPIADVAWNQTSNLVHDSKVVDIRRSVKSLKDFEDLIGKKVDLIPTGGGQFDFNNNFLTWNAQLDLMSAFGPAQNIPANTIAVMDGGSIVYDLNFAGGVIAKGNLAVTVLTGGSTVTFSGSDNLSTVRPGNVLSIGSEIVQLLSIDNVSKQAQVSPSLVGTGAAVIHRDGFGPGNAPFKDNSYVFAIRNGTIIYIGGGTLELKTGETNNIGDDVSQQILTFIGATDETDSSPNYGSTTVITQGDPLVDAISDLDLAVDGINGALAAPIYDERLLFPSGLTASTNITLPNNSRNAGNPQTYTIGAGKLQIFLNQVLKFVGVDYTETSNNTIAFAYALNPDSEVHFRDAVLGGGSGGGGGGGSGTLQDAYNNGRTINVNPGFPVEISGASGKLLKVNGDMDVTGVIDPTGLQLTPVSANPLGSGKGIWTNLSAELIYENGATAKNITQSINNLESGLGVNALTRLMLNNTGSTILKGTPVYSPSAGEIAPARGTVDAEARVIGVAAANIPNASNGPIAYAGMLTGVTGYTHGAYLYLDSTAGVIVDTAPTLGPYSAGFNVVIIGVMENNNFMLQIHHVGKL